jgi:hypothetical protein
MTTSDDWVPLSVLTLADPGTTDLHGVKFKTLPSPNDVPIGMRFSGGLHVSRRRVEFQYAAPERTIQGTFRDGAQVEFGRTTGRIYSIDVGTQSNEGIDALRRRLLSAIQSFEQVRYKGKRQSSENATLVRRVLHDYLTKAAALSEHGGDVA